jgi:DNA-binding transcriptional MerR regulator
LDKAPDAFRTISEVADDLDIPQHVLRFWETRFAQIKPMKRSGGRRYYRPDDVDLLKGIRRLLYGEGYTIRGVQRILKEHGIKSVQALIDESAPSRFGAADHAASREPAADHDDEVETEAEVDVDAEAEEDEIEVAPASLVAERRPPAFTSPAPRAGDIPAPARPAAPPVSAPAEPVFAGPKLDVGKLETALQDLVACRKLLDSALGEG